MGKNWPQEGKTVYPYGEVEVTRMATCVIKQGSGNGLLTAGITFRCEKVLRRWDRQRRGQSRRRNVGLRGRIIGRLQLDRIDRIISIVVIIIEVEDIHDLWTFRGHWNGFDFGQFLQMRRTGNGRRRNGLQSIRTDDGWHDERFRRLCNEMGGSL